MSEDVYDQPRQWCSLCETAAHSQCEDLDLRMHCMHCMICLELIPEEIEVEVDGEFYHPDCLQRRRGDL